MSHAHSHELAMKITDADETHPGQLRAAPDLSGDEDTHLSPGLRPDVLGDAVQRRTHAMVRAALFAGPGETMTIGSYRVLRPLGEGAMGVVYAAHDDKLERTVALKLIRGEVLRRPEGRARTLREARALARLSHPNVVHVYQVGEVEDEIYVAMELLTGPTLRRWLAAQPRKWREVLAVFRQAGEGLAAAHRQGVVHRDFKPANVIVGDDGRVRVLDFGLAHFGDEGEVLKAAPAAGEVTDLLLTQTGAVLGTPAYMAAEQFAGGRGDAKTDQFSFCTALYEALYGQRPFAGDRLDALVAAVRGGQMAPLSRRNEVPGWLHRAVLRGLQPDPATRWPGMDALLAALEPPASRPRWGRIAAVTGSAFALLLGGMGYAWMLTSPGDPPRLNAGRDEAAAQGRAAVTQAQDARVLTEARAALTSDPVQTIRRLSALGSDDPAVWQEARLLAAAAEARGLPEALLRAGERPLAEVQPLAGGGFIGRDDLGAVWQWKVFEQAGTQILAAGAATQLLVARDAPVYAVRGAASIEVFGAGRAQTIDIGAIDASDWRLAADGGALVVSTWMRPNTEGLTGAVYWWDLTRPGSPPRTITLPPETLAVIAADAALVVHRAARGLRVLRPRAGSEALLRYEGTPAALSADGRFVIARPADRDGVMDVLEISTGKSRRVDAEAVTVLGAADVLFTRTSHGRPQVRRESLATGAIAWSLPLPGRAGPSERRLVVDPVHEQFAAAIDDTWGVGDLRRGELTTFVQVPGDASPRWVGPGALMAVTGYAARIYRPARSPVQLRHDGSGCALAPGGRWGVVLPHDVKTGDYTRVELATHATASFRCPQVPQTRDLGGAYESHAVSTVVDDDGQVAMFGTDGWSCWWDAQHGARTGARALPWGALVGLPRGVALAEGAEVEVWSGPEDRVRRWTAAAAVRDLVASPSGTRLAARSELGVQVLDVDTGAVRSVRDLATPMAKAELQASALAWSPDGARLAVLDRVEGGLELSVWDVVGEPREVDVPDHVRIGGHVLEDSPGRPRNRMSFTPGGGAVALTHRHESLLLVDLATRETRQVDVPELFDLHMRSETDALGVEIWGGPVLIDFAMREASRLTPKLEAGGSTLPPIRRGEGGSVWICGALGPGTLIEVAAMDPSPPGELRARLLDLAASL